MKKLFLLLLFPVLLFSQGNSMTDFKQQLDTYISSVNDTRGIGIGGATVIESEAVHFDEGRLYFVGYDMLWGLLKAFQASGDFSYLDIAFKIIEDNQNSALYLDELYNALGLTGNEFNFPSIHYKGFVHFPSYWEQNLGYDATNLGVPMTKTPPIGGVDGTSWFFTNLRYYIDNHTDVFPNNLRTFWFQGATDNNNPLSTKDQGPLYTHNSLHNNIYERYVADIMRVLSHFPSILNTVSDNSLTYGVRLNAVIAHQEEHVWEKFLETNYNANQFQWHVYPTDTHRGSHLASFALSLFVVTGNQKYYDFLEEYMFDFGSSTLAQQGSTSNTVAGVGLLDMFHTETTETILYWSHWDFSRLQDESHAGAEYHILSQCYEEGFFKTTQNSERAIDLSLMEKLSLTDARELLDTPRVPNQGQYAMAQFTQEAFNNSVNENTGNFQQISSWGNLMYNAAVRNVDGSNLPAYQVIDGEGVVNITPVATVNQKRTAVPILTTH